MTLSKTLEWTQRQSEAGETSKLPTRSRVKSALSCRAAAIDPAVLGAAIRAHWSIENAVHWVLDVTFREDDSRVRDHHTAARNLALVRKIAFKLLGRGRPSRPVCAPDARGPPGT